MNQQLELFDLEHTLWLYHKVVTSKVTFVTWEVHHSSASPVYPPEVCDQSNIQTSCHRENDETLQPHVTTSISLSMLAYLVSQGVKSF